MSACGGESDTPDDPFVFAEDEPSTYTRVDRHGMPAINTAVIMDKQGYNEADPANDAAVLAVEFANGTHGTIEVSAVAHVAERWQWQHVVLHGEQGNYSGSGSHAPFVVHKRYIDVGFQTEPVDLRGAI